MSRSGSNTGVVAALGCLFAFLYLAFWGAVIAGVLLLIKTILL